MATVGDPLMDLGTTLAYWVDPDDPPALQARPASSSSRMLPGQPARAARWPERYAARHRP